MRLCKLTIENYKSFQFPTEILFPEADDFGRNIYLIGGMNGAGKTSIMEAINFCLYGTRVENIFRNINRKEKALGNASVSFELALELDDFSDLIVKRSWSAGTIADPKARDLTERLVVVRDGKRVSVQSQEVWQEYIRSAIPPAITQFFFFDGEKIQELASDDHSEVRLKSSLEAALGIQYINQLSNDILNIKQEERKGFVEITDEDLDFKQSELKRERSKLNRKMQDRQETQKDLDKFKDLLEDTKKRFEATFHAAPETREVIREQEKQKVFAANRLTQVEIEIRTICENVLPFGLAGNLFQQIRKQIELERESAGSEAIREHASTLAKRIVRVVEEPEPIYQEKLSVEKMAELERRIYILLKQGETKGDLVKVLNLSDRESARVLNKIENLEKSDIFMLQPLIEEKRALAEQISTLEGFSQFGVISDTERELFDQLQVEIEGCSNQIGRKTEQLRLLEEEIINLEKKINEIELDIEKLYEKHNTSKEKADFIQQCDDIASVLNQFVVRLRKNKILLLQEKTFEMFRLISSRSDLIKDITIDQDSYEIRITDRNGHEIRKSALSAGEKEVFAISLLWGLAQTSQLKLPIIIDTPLSRLDSAHRDSIVNFYFPNAGDQVVILSTDTEIDTDYYKKLKDHLCGAGRLEFDPRQELTIYKQGYFWEN
jgi:DNA sulfur modification protein DndD